MPKHSERPDSEKPPLHERIESPWHHVHTTAWQDRPHRLAAQLLLGCSETQHRMETFATLSLAQAHQYDSGGSPTLNLRPTGYAFTCRSGNK